MRLNLRAPLMLAVSLLPVQGVAQSPDLRQLATIDAARGWEAVGRIDLGTSGFCTGALIEPHIVLTAAHCLFDRDTGQRFDLDEITFLAGWRNGRASAYRGVRSVAIHTAYVADPALILEQIGHDLALLELDQPIRLPQIQPYPVGHVPGQGDVVAVVSYAQDRADLPSIQDSCHVLGRDQGLLLLDCAVNFGASGAPVFAFGNGVAQIVAMVTAMADLEGTPVALGTELRSEIPLLMQELSGAGNRFLRPGTADGRDEIGARFIRP